MFTLNRFQLQKGKTVQLGLGNTTINSNKKCSIPINYDVLCVFACFTCIKRNKRYNLPTISVIITCNETFSSNNVYICTHVCPQLSFIRLNFEQCAVYKYLCV